MRRRSRDLVSGVVAALLSTIFLGWTPIFGKLAYRAGVTPYTLVAGRTILAAMLLWLFYGLVWRQYIRLDRPALLGCVAMGAVNGLGSLMYYTGLSRVDASIASLLNSLYPLWVVIFLAASGQPLSPITMLRLGLASGGVLLLTQVGGGTLDLLGVMLMIASAATYGFHLVLGQWILADVPPPSVTLYVLTTMATVVTIARVGQGAPLEPLSSAGLGAMIGLGIVTALSRLMMFLGLRHLGGVQTALLGLMELFVTLLVAFFLLGERLTPVQWMGGGLLVASVLLVARDTSIEFLTRDPLAELEALAPLEPLEQAPSDVSPLSLPQEQRGDDLEFHLREDGRKKNPRPWERECVPDQGSRLVL